MADYGKYKTLLAKREDKVLTITLNRPEAFNAVNPDMHTELSQIFAEIQRDRETNAVVLTGAGNAFSAGGDVKGMLDRAEGRIKEAPAVSRIFEARKIIDDILDCEKPIIAAVNGPAIGLGATIALFCDVIFASEKARFGDPHVKVGITAGDGGAVIWPLLVGPARAKEFLMTGDIMDAQRAERIGLVNYVVPHDKLQEEALNFAKRLANGPTVAINTTKMSVNKMMKHLSNLVLDYSLSVEMHCFNTEDHVEAARAFVQKRSPKFKGC
jgi:enoyl-CoA hydratase